MVDTRRQCTWTGSGCVAWVPAKGENTGAVRMDAPIDVYGHYSPLTVTDNAAPKKPTKRTTAPSNPALLSCLRSTPHNIRSYASCALKYRPPPRTLDHLRCHHPSAPNHASKSPSEPRSLTETLRFTPVYTNTEDAGQWLAHPVSLCRGSSQSPTAL
jgi:hypothetical protein